MGGFFLGQSLSSPSPGGAGGAAHPATASANAAETGTGAPGSTVDTSNAQREWANPFAAKFAAAAANEPTPGVADAIKDALRLDPVVGEGHLLMLIEAMRKEDFPVAFEILRKAKSPINGWSVGNQGPVMWTAFWRRYGELDPAGALEAVLNAPELNYTNREMLEKHLFQGMARKDPAEAGAALLAHPDMANQSRAVEGIMVVWASRDTKSAIAWGRQNLDPEKFRTALYATTWGITSATDISAANKLLTDLPAEPARVGVINSLKSQIQQKAGLPVPQVLDFFNASRAAGVVDEGFEMALIPRLAERDGFAAANYFAQPTLGGEKGEYSGLQRVLSLWAQKQPEAAEAWAKGQEGTPYYPMVAAQLAAAAVQRNDQAAVKRWGAAAGRK